MELADIGLILQAGEFARNRLADRDGAGIGEVAIIQARADDHVADQALIGCRKAGGIELAIDLVHVVQRHMRQDQVLGVGNADILMAIGLGEMGDDHHLSVGGIACNPADRLVAHRDGGIAGLFVGVQVRIGPECETRIGGFRALEGSTCRGFAGQLRRREISVDTLDLGLGQGDLLGLALGFELGLHQVAEGFLAGFRDKDLDPRLVLVIASAEAVIDPHDGFQIIEQFALGHEIGDLCGDMGRAPLAAADMHLETDLPAALAHMQADIMHADRRAVMAGRGDGDLELARQEGKFRVECAPLADDLAPGARVHHLVGCGAGKMVGGGVADAVARGLDGVHLDIGEQVQHVGNVFQRDPIELDVLARRPVAIALVIVARDAGELAQLARIELAIGNGHAQHVCVQLEIDPVLQAQRLELVFQKLAGKPALHLATELVHTIAHDLRVEFVISVHSSLSPYPRFARHMRGARGCS